jgi:hypothetical protein
MYNPVRILYADSWSLKLSEDGMAQRARRIGIRTSIKGFRQVIFVLFLPLRVSIMP